MSFLRLVSNIGLVAVLAVASFAPIGVARAEGSIEIPLSSLVGKWKVSQNRAAGDRAGVVDGLLRERDDTALAAEVRAPGGGA